MDSKELKKKRKALLEQEAELDPDFGKGKKLALRLPGLWFISRLICFIFYVQCVSEGLMENQLGRLIFEMAVCFLFAFAVQRGVELFAILPIIGGFFMIVSSFTGGAYAFIGPGYIFPVRMYFLSYIISSWLQVLLMGFLLISKKSLAYFRAVEKINRELSGAAGQPSGPRL